MPAPHHYPDSPTLRAVAAVGGVTRAKELCGVSLRTVQNWCEKGKVANLTAARLLERKTDTPLDLLLDASAKAAPMERSLPSTTSVHECCVATGAEPSKTAG